MAAGLEGGDGAGSVDKGSYATLGHATTNGGSSHATPTSGPARGHLPSKSVDLVRGQWEQKIQIADKADDTPKASKRYTIMSPPSTVPSVFAEPQPMESPVQSSSASLSRQTSVASSVTSNSTTDSVLSRYREKVGNSQLSSDPAAGVGARRDGVKGMSVDAAASKPLHLQDPIVPPSPAFSDVSTTSTTSTTSSLRPGSVASYVSYHSVLSPESTGASSQASGRSQAMEDTLAQARANALKRREARLKAQGKDGTAGASSASEAESLDKGGVNRAAGGTLKQAESAKNASQPMDESKVPTLKAAPPITDSSTSIPATPRSNRFAQAAAAFENGDTPVSAPKGVPSTPTKQTSTPAMEPKKGSPFAHLFTPPSTTASDSNPASRSDSTSGASRSTATDETPKSRSYRTNAPANSRAVPADGAKDARAEYTAARAGLVPSGLGIGRGPPPSAYNPAGATGNPGLRVPSAGAGAGKDKYGSISSTDRRRLGRHLPRIASGGEGWEGIEDGAHAAGGKSPAGTVKRVPSNLGLSSASGIDNTDGRRVQDEDEKEAATSRADKRRSVDILAPRPPSVASVASVRSIFDPPAQSSTDTTTSASSRPAPATVPSSRPEPSKQALPVQTEHKSDQPAPYTPNKRRSAYIEHLAQVQAQSNTPTKEIGAGEMKGLIKAVGATPVRGPGARAAKQDDGEGVTGKIPPFRTMLPTESSHLKVGDQRSGQACSGPGVTMAIHLHRRS